MAPSEILSSPSHPLSEQWGQVHTETFCNFESTELLDLVSSWIQTVSTNCGDLVPDKALSDLSSTDITEYAVFLDQRQEGYPYQAFPASSLLHEIPDNVLTTLLSSFSDISPVVYIKSISKELKRVFCLLKTLEKENKFLKTKLYENETIHSESSQADTKAYDYNLYSELASKSLSINQFSPTKSIDGRLDILSDLIKESQTLDSPECCTVSHNTPVPERSFVDPTEKCALTGTNLDFPYSLPNYDSDDSTEESCSLRSSTSDKVDGASQRRPNHSKAINDAENITSCPRPFHFRAIALASSLLTNSSVPGQVYPSTKRASKRIIDWTLGLLKSAKIGKSDGPNPLTTCEPYDDLVENFNSPEYEMEIQPNLKGKRKKVQVQPLKRDIAFQELTPPTSALTSPFSQEFPPSSDSLEISSCNIIDETNCVEMTPLQHSRRGSIGLMSPTFPTGSAPTTGTESEYFVLHQSSCTSPTTGISTLTTQAIPSSSTALPTVSKLLSRIIDSHNDHNVLSYEERWNIFMDTHAPRINSQHTSSVDHSFSSLPHPLVPSPSFDSSQNHPEFSSSRQRIVLNRLSSEERREFRRLARAGIPLPFRAKVWYECSGAAQMNEAGYFHGLVLETMSSTHLPYKEQIELDIHRTMPNNDYFSRNGPGVAKLRRILLAYSIHNSVVGYCQSMNLITATLLLTLSSEEEVFWTLACLIERILPSEYFTSDLLVSQADQCVLSDQVAEFLPNLTAHFNLLEVDLGAIMFSWFLTLYADCVSFHVLVRIWDVLLVEGPATLFRFALSLLEFYEKDILSCHTSSAVYSCLKNLPLDAGRHLDQVTKLAFCTYKSRVTYDQIKLRRKSHLDALRAQFYL